MEDGVAILLGIRDPDDRVYAWEELVDACAVLGRRRVDVRQVEDRYIAEAAGVVIAYLANAEPVEQRSGLAPRAGRDPCHGRIRRGTTCARRTDDIARQRVEQARLADAGATDQGEHVCGAFEPESGAGSFAHAPRARRVDTERGGGIGRVGERREADRKRHGSSATRTPRSPVARSRSSAGSATSLS